MYDKLKSLSLEEIIGYAIMSEEEAGKYYRGIVKNITSGSLVAHRFESIAKDEDLHMAALLDLHKKEFGTMEYKIPEGIPPFESVAEVSNIKNLTQALNTAMQNEDSAHRVYLYLADNMKKHRKLFKYLAHYEQTHYEILKRELNHFQNEMSDENYRHPEDPLSEDTRDFMNLGFTNK